MKKIIYTLQGFSSRISDEQNRGSYNEPPNEPPPVKRHFEFERKQYPWMPHSGYTDIGYNEEAKSNVLLSEWGRGFTPHAVDRTMPSGERYHHNGPYDTGPYEPSEGRSVSPGLVERTICYGHKVITNDGRTNYILGDLEVGVSKDENRVHYVNYTHKKGR